MQELKIFVAPELPEDRFPEYQTAGSAGFDLHVWIKLGGVYCLPPGQSAIFHTGVYIMPPEGYEVQIRSRSGLAFKHGVFVTNAPGTIDSDYRGECCIVLTNIGPEEYIIRDGDRIAQGVLKPAPQAKLVQVPTISMDTARGDKGYGSTGQ